MNEFPYIAESNQSKVPWLIYSESLAICLGNELHSYKKINNYDLVEFFSKNITAEYLRNTKVKIESEDHEVFVREISSSANLKCAVLNDFAFIFDNFIEDADKLITIPLPPKEENMSKVQINVNNNTDSVVQVTKSDDESNIFIHVNDLPKSKEWPTVGDEVLICKNVNLLELHRFNGKRCKVIGVCEHDDKKVLTLSHKNCGLAAMNMGEWIKKPPTPEEELESQLRALMSADSCGSYEDLSKAIINGEIEGLEYKHD